MTTKFYYNHIEVCKIHLYFCSRNYCARKQVYWWLYVSYSWVQVYIWIRFKVFLLKIYVNKYNTKCKMTFEISVMPKNGLTSILIFFCKRWIILMPFFHCKFWLSGRACILFLLRMTLDWLECVHQFEKSIHSYEFLLRALKKAFFIEKESFSVLMNAFIFRFYFMGIFHWVV